MSEANYEVYCDYCNDAIWTRNELMVTLRPFSFLRLQPFHTHCFGEYNRQSWIFDRIPLNGNGIKVQAVFSILAWLFWFFLPILMPGLAGLEVDWSKMIDWMSEPLVWIPLPILLLPALYWFLGWHLYTKRLPE